jgi:trimeric autotransporter adhesin
MLAPTLGLPPAAVLDTGLTPQPHASSSPCSRCCLAAEIATAAGASAAEVTAVIAASEGVPPPPSPSKASTAIDGVACSSSPLPQRRMAPGSHVHGHHRHTACSGATRPRAATLKLAHRDVKAPRRSTRRSVGGAAAEAIDTGVCVAVTRAVTAARKAVSSEAGPGEERAYASAAATSASAAASAAAAAATAGLTAGAAATDAAAASGRGGGATLGLGSAASAAAAAAAAAFAFARAATAFVEAISPNCTGNGSGDYGSKRVASATSKPSMRPENSLQHIRATSPLSSALLLLSSPLSSHLGLTTGPGHSRRQTPLPAPHRRASSLHRSPPPQQRLQPHVAPQLGRQQRRGRPQRQGWHPLTPEGEEEGRRRRRALLPQPLPLHALHRACEAP